MSEPNSSTTKRSVADQILTLDNSLFIHVKVNTPGVLVPQSLQKKSYVVLQVGFDMPVPIPDLRVTEEGVSGTLSFRGVPFFCVVPWDAVSALINDKGRGQVYDTSYLNVIGQEEEPPRKLKNGKSIPAYLRVVK